MDISKLKIARSLYYKCLGELFTFSLSGQRLTHLNEYLSAMKQGLFDESLASCFDFLLENLEKTQSPKDFYEEYDKLFLTLKNAIPITFSYIEEGFENSKALLNVKQILAKSSLRRNEKNFKESEDSVGFCFLLMSEFIKEENNDLAKELFAKLINKNIDEFLKLIFENQNANLYKQVALIAMAFMEFERFCFELEKPMTISSKKVQNDLSRSEFLRRESNKQRRAREKSQGIS
ncbi:molecular chaperone [Campylobacter sp. US33a]|uniref:TorD/DmsD family molecular chaperone n=1 Tax=Campylobacter sp. US33a TaxID=2498120 RepID=UPI001067CACE|nr:molecular chaperone TorD family protein [Campylobacter sp. US33a]TEY03928.1 hypothetical protein ELQ16_01415 [Campylobacter sp. US33a]